MRQNPAFWLEIITKQYIVLSDIVKYSEFPAFKSSEMAEKLQSTPSALPPHRIQVRRFLCALRAWQIAFSRHYAALPAETCHICRA